MHTTAEISVLVVDQTMVAYGLGRLIDDQPDLRVVGIATSGAASLRGAQRWRPSVVVLADRLSDGSGACAAATLVECVPASQVVMLTCSAPDEVRAKAEAAGCAAVLSKAQPVDDLLAAVRAVHADAPDQPQPPTARPRRPQLSRRQLQVLQLLAEGASTDSMADALYLSVNTVRNHVQHTIGRLGAHSRLEAVAIGLRAGLIESP